MFHGNIEHISQILESVKQHDLYSMIGFGSRVQYKDEDKLKCIVEEIYTEVGGFKAKNPVFIYNGDPSNDGSIGVAYAHLSFLMKKHGGFLIMSQIEDAKQWSIDENMYIQGPILYVPSSKDCPVQCKYGGVDYDGAPVANTKSIVLINNLRIQRSEKPIKKIFVICDKLNETDIEPSVSVIAYFERLIFKNLRIPVIHKFTEAKNKDLLYSVQNEIHQIIHEIGIRAISSKCKNF
jgi:hypothetical protein